MAKTYLNTVKYLIQIDFEIKGIIEKPDIIGAIFGQSEGLLGEDMDLRELQKNGRVGRIEINMNTNMGKTRGTILIPSSMDMVETSILGAAIESVDKVGPCEARFKTKQIEDTRSLKRKEIISRAQNLLRNLMNTQLPETQEIAELVRNNVRTAEAKTYGPEKLTCGPNIEEEDAIIIVEGRADVINLLKNNIKNVICMGGSKIPKSIADLTKRKTVTMFVDGDRGGELNIKKMEQLGDIDFVARAPDGKEVEELTRKEIIMALRRKVPLDQVKTKNHDKDSKEYSRDKPGFSRRDRDDRNRTDKKGKFSRPSTPLKREEKPVEKEEASEEEKGMFQPVIKELKGSLKAKLLDEKGKEIEEVAIRDLLKKLDKKKKINAIVFDGIVTKRVVDEAKKHGIKYVVGIKKGKFPVDKDIKVLTMN